MIRRPLVGLVVTVAITFIGDPAVVQAAEQPVAAQRVMVKLSDGRWETRALRAPTATTAALRVNDPEIVEIAQNRVYRQFVSSRPDDPAFDLQWHLTRNQASRSWQYGDGTGVVVAVIDSGVAPVSDLACHTYVAPADFVFGISPGTPPDSNGHGTLVTQVIGECTDNGEYGAGTAPGAGLMPLRVLDSSGSTSSDRLFDALFWALDHGADVVNLSLGFVCEATYPTCSDSGVDYAIETLVAHGVVIVAASGNDGGGLLAYPANHPSVIAVGASGYDGAVASYSTRGSGLELVAPTGDQDDPINRDGVIHQGASGGLHIVNGTSFSSPQVAAAYALLMSAGASPQQATSALLQSAQDIPTSGYDTATGYGDLRIRDALAWGGTGLTPPIRDASFYAAGDATGDGRADSIIYDGRFGRWWVSSSAGSSFSASEWTRYSTTSGWSIHTTGDFNGDSRLDLASFHPSNGTWWISPSNGSSFATRLWADFSTASGWGPQLVGDFTGDGRDDIASYHGSNGTWWVSRSTGTGFATTLWADFSTASGWKTHLVGDFTGDGKDDIASYHPSNGTWWVSRSTGSGFSTSLWADFSTASGWAPQLVGDYNGDGKDDIANYHASNGTWWVSRSTGSAFSTGLWADYSTASGYTFQAGADFTGDGRDDIANHHRTGVWIVSRSVGSSFTTSTWFD